MGGIEAIARALNSLKKVGIRTRSDSEGSDGFEQQWHNGPVDAPIGANKAAVYASLTGKDRPYEVWLEKSCHDEGYQQFLLEQQELEGGPGGESKHRKPRHTTVTSFTVDLYATAPAGVYHASLTPADSCAVGASVNILNCISSSNNIQAVAPSPERIFSPRPGLLGGSGSAHIRSTTLSPLGDSVRSAPSADSPRASPTAADTGSCNPDSEGAADGLSPPGDTGSSTGAAADLQSTPGGPAPPLRTPNPPLSAQDCNFPGGAITGAIRLPSLHPTAFQPATSGAAAAPGTIPVPAATTPPHPISGRSSRVMAVAGGLHGGTTVERTVACLSRQATSANLMGPSTGGGGGGHGGGGSGAATAAAAVTVPPSDANTPRHPRRTSTLGNGLRQVQFHQTPPAAAPPTEQQPQQQQPCSTGSPFAACTTAPGGQQDRLNMSLSARRRCGSVTGSSPASAALGGTGSLTLPSPLLLQPQASGHSVLSPTTSRSPPWAAAAAASQSPSAHQQHHQQQLLAAGRSGAVEVTPDGGGKAGSTLPQSLGSRSATTWQGRCAVGAARRSRTSLDEGRRGEGASEDGGEMEGGRDVDDAIPIDIVDGAGRWFDAGDLSYCNLGCDEEVAEILNHLAQANANTSCTSFTCPLRPGNPGPPAPTGIGGFIRSLMTHPPPGVVHATTTTTTTTSTTTTSPGTTGSVAISLPDSRAVSGEMAFFPACEGSLPSIHGAGTGAAGRSRSERRNTGVGCEDAAEGGCCSISHFTGGRRGSDCVSLPRLAGLGGSGTGNNGSGAAGNSSSVPGSVAGSPSPAWHMGSPAASLRTNLRHSATHGTLINCDSDARQMDSDDVSSSGGCFEVYRSAGGSAGGGGASGCCRPTAPQSQRRSSQLLIQAAGRRASTGIPPPGVWASAASAAAAATASATGAAAAFGPCPAASVGPGLHESASAALSDGR